MGFHLKTPHVLSLFNYGTITPFSHPIMLWSQNLGKLVVFWSHEFDNSRWML